MHLHQLVEVGNLHAGTACDALFAAGLQQGGVGALFLGHRLNEGDLLLEDLIVETSVFDLFRHFPHAGHHAHHALHAAHFDHLFKLHLEVVHIELTLRHALHHLFGLLGLDGFLGFLNQRDNVAHAEDTARDALRLESLKRVHLFAQTDEFDRLASHGTHRERRTATAIAVHPSQDDTGDADTLVKVLGGVHGVLAGQAVDHQ